MYFVYLENFCYLCKRKTNYYQLLLWDYSIFYLAMIQLTTKALIKNTLVEINSAIMLMKKVFMMMTLHGRMMIFDDAIFRGRNEK